MAIHAAQGIMKAHWKSSDFAEMLWRPMRFTAEDAEWIRNGLRLRRQTEAARKKAAAGGPIAPAL
jgi:hypothetical protein